MTQAEDDANLGRFRQAYMDAVEKSPELKGMGRVQGTCHAGIFVVRRWNEAGGDVEIAAIVRNGVAQELSEKLRPRFRQLCEALQKELLK